MRKDKVRISVIAALSSALLVFSASSAYASVVFDPATGAGWVGKGDVQLAFGWNNKQLQANQGAVTFQYNEHTAFDVTCEYEQANGNRAAETKTKVQNKVANILGKLTADSRLKNQQYTGWFLTEFSDWQSTESIPVKGDSCTAAGITGQVINVDVGVTDGKLQVFHDLLSAIIWTTPVPVLAP